MILHYQQCKTILNIRIVHATKSIVLLFKLLVINLIYNLCI